MITLNYIRFSWIALYKFTETGTLKLWENGAM